MPELQKSMKLGDVSCVHIHDMYVSVCGSSSGKDYLKYFLFCGEDLIICLCLWKMTQCNSQINFCNYQNLIKMTRTSLFQHELLGPRACYIPWVEKQYTHNWTLHLTRRNFSQMEHCMTANAIGKSYSRLEHKPVKITPMSVILHYQGESPRNHRCLCSASISVFISLIFFLKTLVSSLHNKDPKLCCMGNRNKLYVKFALEGSEVIGPAITPAFLTNSWRPREAWPSSVLLQQRAVIHCQ